MGKRRVPFEKVCKFQMMFLKLVVNASWRKLSILVQAIIVHSCLVTTGLRQACHSSCFMECKIGIDIISPHAFGSESMLPLTRIHV
ncbi:hypothetical protein A4A49_01727 [Nicotiana attenuata]|uniref:Uncharacterized protein n=1 Tax=Nicotiana attenuata TaxID=49451 RepID=A0A1J6IQT7_NICAT|nr:hypothetical protein A4A49_01727 [Nicotiana attenuata]